MTDKYAKALKANGIDKGDCVSMCLSYTPEVLCLVLACSKIGALANFINPLFTTEQKIARLNEAESKVTIILDAMFPYMKDAVKTINTDKIVILPASGISVWVILLGGYILGLVLEELSYLLEWIL